jgi:RNA polymerase sigma factor (sigma-70 family)
MAPKDKPPDDPEDGGMPSQEPPSEEYREFIEGLFKEHYAWLVRAFGKNRRFAQDAVHEAFIELQRSGSDPELIRSPKAYVMKVVLRIARKMARDSSSSHRLIVDSEFLAQLDEASLIESMRVPAGDGGEMAEAFAQLTELQQQVFGMSAEDGMSTWEIAEALDISWFKAQRARTTAWKVMQAVAPQSSQGRKRK